jgi:hypothetical protein
MLHQTPTLIRAISGTSRTAAARASARDRSALSPTTTDFPARPSHTSAHVVSADRRHHAIERLALERYEREWRQKANVPFNLSFTLRDLGERPNAARWDIVDPRARLGYLFQVY